MVGLDIRRSDTAARLVRTADLGGILVRGVPGADTARRLAQIREAGRERPLIAVDEEGGRVQHLRGIVGSIPSARTMAKTMTPAQVTAVARRHAEAMRALGFTMVFAPVLDLQGPANNGIGDRAFSADPAVVARYGSAFAEGFVQAGITPVLKHFPGHGNATGDSHYAGVSTPPLAELRARDIAPFAQVTRSMPVGVMTAHLNVPGADGLPASVSPAITDRVLRRELGFDGLVVTDSLSMHPIRYHWNRARAAQLALGAGADLLLFDDLPNVADIVTALVASARSDPYMAFRLVESNLRILAAKGRLCAGTTPGDAAEAVAPTTTAPAAVG
jgi:beta-N-acetylhexosaminidase